MASSGVALPTGWVAKWDANSRRTYYIDHRNHKTQWDDPRIHSGEVWTPQRMMLLQNLHTMFPFTTENTLREALVMCNMDSSKVREQLIGSGQVPRETPQQQAHQQQPHQQHHQHQTPNKRTASPKASVFTVQSPAKAASKPDSTLPHVQLAQKQQDDSASSVDEFQVMYIKSHVSGVPDNIIQDVLASCKNDAIKAIEELESMGFDERKAVTSNHTTEIQVTDADRKRIVVDTLSSEFPFAARQHIVTVTEGCGLDIEATRKALKQEEAMRQLSSQFSQLNADEILTALSQCDMDVTQARPLLMAYVEEKKQKQQKQKDLYATPKKTRSSPKRTPQKKVGQDGAPRVSGMYSSSKTDVSKPYTHKTLALGPNPDFAKGPDASLLGNKTYVAHGPDANNRKGPNPALLIRA